MRKNSEGKEYRSGLTTEMRVRIVVAIIGLFAFALMALVSDTTAKNILLPILVFSILYWIVIFFFKPWLALLGIMDNGSMSEYTFGYLWKKYPVVFRFLIFCFSIMVLLSIINDG